MRILIYICTIAIIINLAPLAYAQAVVDLPTDISYVTYKLKAKDWIGKHIRVRGQFTEANWELADPKQPKQPFIISAFSIPNEDGNYAQESGMSILGYGSLFVKHKINNSRLFNDRKDVIIEGIVRAFPDKQPNGAADNKSSGDDAHNQKANPKLNWLEYEFLQTDCCVSDIISYPFYIELTGIKLTKRK